MSSPSPFPYKKLLPFRGPKVDAFIPTSTSSVPTEAFATSTPKSTLSSKTTITTPKTTAVSKTTTATAIKKQNGEKKRLSLESQVILLSPANANGNGKRITESIQAQCIGNGNENVIATVIICGIKWPPSGNANGNYN